LSRRTNLTALDGMAAVKTPDTDLRSLGERQRHACTVGSHAAVAIGHRAQAGAKMLYEYLNEHFGSPDAGMEANGATGKVVPLPPARPSQHTLSRGDLAPAWRGPQPHREARRDRPA